MKALKSISPGVAKVVESPLPKLRPDYILVKVSAVALNPTDWKHIDTIATENATVGCDFAGTVVEVGPEVQKRYSKGDRIAGVAHGVNAVQPEDGTFAEYAVVKGALTLKIPDDFTDQDAATTGIGVTTVGQGLYQSLKLPLPDQPSSAKTPILIYGGSTATGLWAIQYAKLSGFSPIVTCSPKNFGIVKDYGADEAFDYTDPQCGAKIRELTKNSLHHAFDTIGSPGSAQIAADALSSEGGGRWSSIIPVELPRKDITTGHVLAYTATGEAFTFRGGKSYEARPEDLEYGSKFWSLTEKLLAQGKLKAPPIEVRKGGLDAILEGLDDLRKGKVSGKKIVYPL